MNYKHTFTRYELKYLITTEQEQMLKSVMREHVERDKFGKTTINNIYFDTPSKLLIRRSIEKPIYKEKLRLRSYGASTSKSTVFIELKKKYAGIVYKRRIHMDEKEAMNYLCKREPISNATQISREIDYFFDLYNNIEPSILLSYEREGFFGKKDRDFRITFDKNILFRDYDLSLTKGLYGTSILPPNIVLFEVKTAINIPLWLAEFLSKHAIYKTAFSKYGSAYKKILLPKLLGEIKYVS